MKYIPGNGVTACDYHLDLQMGEIKDFLSGNPYFKGTPERQMPG